MTHRKKSNIGLIFELLNKHYIKFLLENKEEKAKNVFGIMLKYFNPKIVLSEELDLFNVLLYTPISSFELGSRLLSEVKIAVSKLDEVKIRDYKYKILLEIYETIGKDFFSLPIKQYKQFASVHQLLNDYRGNSKIHSIQDKIMLEENIIANLIDSNSIEEPAPQFSDMKNKKLVEKLAYKIYDEKYSDYFSDGQKRIINEYTSNKDFTKYAQSKFKVIGDILLSKDVKMSDDNLRKRIREAVEKAKSEHLTEDKNELAYRLMLYQELLDETEKLHG